MKALHVKIRHLLPLGLTVTAIGVALGGCATETPRETQAAVRRIEAPPQQTAPAPLATRPQVAPERQAVPLGEIPWRARVQSSPEGADVYLLEDGEPGRLLGKTPLTVAIWTDTIVGRPGQMGQRTLTFHVPVLRTKDGFYRGFLIKSGDAQVQRYATWSEGLRDAQPSGGLLDVGGGLAYSLRQGRSITLSGSLTMAEMIPASYEKEFPPPRISEIMVDFAGELKKQ